MIEDENLRSKYERLCVEFKKLRTKYQQAIKTGTLVENGEKGKHYKELLDQKDTCISQLREEIKILKFRNEYLSKQTEFVQSQLIKTDENVADRINNEQLQPTVINSGLRSQRLKESKGVVSDEPPVFDENKQFECQLKSKLSNSMHPVTNGNLAATGRTVSIQTEPISLHDFKLSYSKSIQTLCQSSVCLVDKQSVDYKMFDDNAGCNSSESQNDSRTLSSPPLASSPTMSPKTEAAEVAVFDQDVNEAFFEKFIQAINDWLVGLHSVRENLKSDLTNVLNRQIVNLESKLCEVTVELQIERKRRLFERKNLDEHREKCVGTEDGILEYNKLNDTSQSEKQSFLQHLMKKRLSTAIEEAQYFAGLANLFQDELESLLPWIVQLTRLNYQQFIQLSRINESKTEMQTQLDLTKKHTVKQINEMAVHIANMTDELQTLRSSNCTNPSPIQSNKKTSIFNVLKR